MGPGSVAPASTAVAATKNVAAAGVSAASVPAQNVGVKRTAQAAFEGQAFCPIFPYSPVSSIMSSSVTR